MVSLILETGAVSVVKGRITRGGRKEKPSASEVESAHKTNRKRKRTARKLSLRAKAIQKIKDK